MDERHHIGCDEFDGGVALIGPHAMGHGHSLSLAVSALPAEGESGEAVNVSPDFAAKAA